MGRGKIVDRLNYILRKPGVRVAIYLILIIGITLGVYYPTFVHLFRGEIYTYFAEVEQGSPVFSNITNYYKYEKTRLLSPGDPLSFRPLQWTVIGIENALFGINYVYWRIATFFIHLLATFCLFRLLWKIKPSVIVLLATLLFSTSFIGLRTVLYDQMTTYTLFTALVLTGFYYAYCGVESGKKRHLIIASISMLAACFLQELGIPFTILVIGYFWLERKRPNFNWKRGGLALGIVPLLYLAAYIPEKFINPSPLLGKGISQTITWQAAMWTFLGGAQLAYQWLCRTILPSIFTQIVPTDLRMTSPKRAITDLAKASSGWLSIPHCIAVAIMVKVFFLTKAKQISQHKNAPLFTLLIGSLIVLVLANTAFRVGVYGMNYLLSHNVCIYFWIALFIATAYAFISFKGLTKHVKLISIALVIFLSLSAPKAFIANQSIKAAEEPTRVYFQKIEDFIELRKDEPNFSFNSTTVPTAEKDLQFVLWKGIGDSTEWTPCYLTVPQVLYWDYWSEDNPKYSLTYYPDNNKLEVETNE